MDNVRKENEDLIQQSQDASRTLLEELVERFASAFAALLKIHNRSKTWEGPPPAQAVDFLSTHLPTQHKPLKWINQQQSDMRKEWANKLHLAVCLNVPDLGDLPHSDMHAQWEILNAHAKIDH